ncbi:Eco57I restriction-modification methylase domain-containing protein [Haloplanus salilacus]|uniref:Eco57I restriction-modification methylase domain-containing protein n=1 Tax=Haloplanus salilacus TaxID=2949994 RepID=UPI0030CE7607
MSTALTYRTNRDLFSNHYLDKHLPETEAWDELDEDELRETKADIAALWNREKETAPKRNESQLEEKFIRPMFRKLGIPFEVEESTSRTQRRPDYGFFESEAAARGAFERREDGGDFYEDAVAVADAKRWGRPLDTRGSGDHERDFENPSYQIHVYLQETPARWAVLTDGKKWRLYYAPTSHRLDSYYEVDLPTVLEQGDLEEFKYFYLFFRHGAFLEDASGDCFLDDVYDESTVFARELGDDLQDNVYEAIKVLSEGFMQYPGNDLSKADLDRIHDSSLVYLYRLIFVLYAESEGRDLLDTNNEIYEDSYSLNSLKQDIAEELDSPNPKYRDWQDDLWDRLDELFKLIDQGSKSRSIPEEDLYIPAYNGGLFRTDPDEDDSAEARFLANHRVGDTHLAEVIELLTRSRSDGGGKTFVDYSSLDVRHLGSIYEGLLEYRLDVADEPLTLEDGEYVPAGEGDEVIVEAGDVHLTTGSGERKATGSYYTPEYVVEYIVEETLEPLVDDVYEDLLASDPWGHEGGGQFAEDFADRVFELKVLDPAMGSGHFLTNAIDYLAREIINAQERQAEQQGIESIDRSRDINWARRQVAQRCIYGVDLNPLAVELAKVSLWLRTLAAEQPLAFLDHHLKAGNSLVGSDVGDVLSDGESATADGQLTLQQSFAQARRQALEHVMDRFQDLLSVDNESLAAIKEMEAAFQGVRGDPLYQRLLAMANVHTAEAFGLDVPSDAYERMAEALRDDSWEAIQDRDWFRSAQAMAEEESFFHWQLEFPVAFYDSNGNRQRSAGFDAVIGNPPYISAWNRDLGQDEFLRTRYGSASGHYDIYGLFIERGSELLRRTGRVSMIVPDTFCGQAYAENCRKLFASELSLETVLDLRERVVFEDAQVDNIIFVARGDSGIVENVSIEAIETKTEGEFVSTHTFPYDLLSEGNEYRIPLSEEGLNMSIREKVSEGVALQNAFYVSKGMEPHTADGDSKYDFIETDDPDEVMKRYIEGKHIGRWRIHSNWYIDYSPTRHKAPAFRELFETRKIVGARTIGEGRPMFAVDEEGYYNNEKTLNAVPYEALRETDVSQVEVSRQNRQYSELFSMYATVGILNSSVTSFTFREIESGALDFFPRHLKKICLPVPEGVPDYDAAAAPGAESTERSRAELYAALHRFGTELSELRRRRDSLDTNILDYLGNYEAGPALPDVGLFQPTDASILDATTEEYENLRVGGAQTERDGRRVTLYATARYKPEDEDEHETDRWGYTESDYREAFSLTDLDDEEAALVEAFVSVAVAEADGFAGFRDNATKTNSLIDRLKAITLPDPDDVADDLRRYIEVAERADELDEKIEKTDRRIDEAVYDLYGLTDEEIEIVESVVQDD